MRRGKVRDVYDLGDGRLLLVATDRISAFDWVLPTPIPDKGRVLTQLSKFWFERMTTPHHLISTELEDAGLDLTDVETHELHGRVMIARKAEVVPFECVVRGYLAGSAWKEYRKTGYVCGIEMDPGLVESCRIDPIFTPATKAESGHDENIAFWQMAASIGSDLAILLLAGSVKLYLEAAAHAESRGLILADTKFEWGRAEDGSMIVVDEVLTPDSARWWPRDGYHPGRPQPSFDKQFVRDWLEASGWDKASPPPPLPDEVVTRTRDKYIEAYERLTDATFAWK
ncbi:MAG: phosphoribosylaminoimidazolesuccinocarboxamide synthase [Planctomycetota bacterium]|nr:phosphoribosylaminoimidazolesuccinocarboxamide synthase [Planctomycetota bacterium]